MLATKGHQVEVRFVDYGNQATLVLGEVAELSKRDRKTPVQAFVCVLEGCEDIKEWEAELESKDFLTTLVCTGWCGEKVLVREAGWLGEASRQVEVQVQHTEDEVVWVLPCTDQGELDRVEEELERMDREGQMEVVGKPHGGQLAVARFSQDGLLYRCVVKTVSSGGVSVYFLDWGNMEEVEKVLHTSCSLLAGGLAWPVRLARPQHVEGRVMLQLVEGRPVFSSVTAGRQSGNSASCQPEEALLDYTQMMKEVP